MILSRTVGNTKPPLGARINLAHPLARGLRYGLVMNEGGGPNLYSVILDVPAMTISGAPLMWSVKARGLAGQADGSLTVGTTTTAILSGVTAFTIVLLMNQPSAGAVGNGMWFGTKTAYNSGIFAGGLGGAPGTQFYVGANVISGSSPAYDTWNSVAYRYSGSPAIQQVWIDGVDQGYAPGAPPASVPTHSALEAFRNTVTGLPSNVMLSCALCYTRALSPFELRWLAVEPFGMLHTTRPHRPMDVPAAAGTTWGHLLGGQRNQLVVSA